MHKKRKGLFEEVYKMIRKIPEGKVVTYGQIAAIVNSKLSIVNRIDGRVVGWALHANRDEGCPCHRVVNKDGRLAENFAFDGADEQRRKLVSEGVEFVDKMHVDLGKALWQPQE